MQFLFLSVVSGLIIRGVTILKPWPNYDANVHNFTSRIQKTEPWYTHCLFPESLQRKRRVLS